MLSHPILSSQKATLSIIPYHFTIHPTSQNSIFSQVSPPPSLNLYHRASTAQSPPLRLHHAHHATTAHQNPTGTKTHTSPINTEKKKKNQNLDTATIAVAKSMFPPSLINPDWQESQHHNRKKKYIYIYYFVETRRVNHNINISSTVMCDVDVGRRMVFGSEERREQMRKREGRERREKFRGK